MVIPLAMLAILAFVVIRSLMGVVAHDEVAAPVTFAAETASPVPARGNDDGRGMLLPAAGGAEADAGVAVDLTVADANAS